MSRGKYEVKKLDTHCGICSILDICDIYTPMDSNYKPLCYQDELQNLDDKKDKEKIEKWCKENLEEWSEEE